MEKRVTWEKAEVASNKTKEKQNANDGHGGKRDCTAVLELPKNE